MQATMKERVAQVGVLVVVVAGSCRLLHDVWRMQSEPTLPNDTVTAVCGLLWPAGLLAFSLSKLRRPVERARRMWLLLPVMATMLLGMYAMRNLSHRSLMLVMDAGYVVLVISLAADYAGRLRRPIA